MNSIPPGRRDEQPNRLPARDRYMRDPMFQALVDALAAAVERSDITPTELREAATFACELVEHRNVHWFGHEVPRRG